MVPSWRAHTTLRVFLPVNANTDNTVHKEQKLGMFLRQLRIMARIQVVSWDHLQHYLQDPSLSTEGEEDGDKIQEYREVSLSLPAGPQSGCWACNWSCS